MQNKNVVVKKSTFEHLAPSGRGWHAVPGEGVLNKEHFMGTPSSPLRGTSPARGEVNSGFTLIELLVVVLIIGILAAVAVPQYQKAVEKSRATQALSLLKSIAQATETYYTANGTYPDTFEQLDLSLPADWTGNTSFYDLALDSHSNGEWSIGIEKRNSYQILWLGKISGVYAGAGFFYATKGPGVKKKEIMCVETIQNGIPFSKNQGDYCQKIMGATYYTGAANHYVYSL